MNQGSKAELRRLLKERRLTMTAEERAANSRAICEKLVHAIDWAEIGTVHYFEPIEKLGEVDTGEFIAGLQHVGCYTSQKFGGAWRIVSSDKTPMGMPPKFDAVIVPMLGFDDRLHRIGYGGGYYDRLLSAQPQAQKIGVCFETGRLEHIPAESHDIPLDIIITESTVHRL